MNELKLLKEKASINIHSILDSLKVSYSDRHTYLSAPCPVHEGRNKNGWSWHLDKGTWQCYTNHCHNEHDCDIYGLIRAIKECSFRGAKVWLQKNIGNPISSKEIRELRDQQSNREFINQTKRTIAKKKIYPKSCLEKLQSHNYLEKERGYTSDIIRKYRAGFAATGYMNNRIVFPIIDINEDIIGFTGRTLTKDWHKRKIAKWFHSREYQKNSNLFNINNAQEHIRRIGTAIIVEGPLDVLRLEEAGIHNSVALLGKILHNRQMTLLMSVPADNLKFALDADGAGKSGAKKGMDLARSFFGVEIINLPNGKDCGDLTIEEAKEIFNENEDTWSLSN